jgi:hypothetical protein
MVDKIEITTGKDLAKYLSGFTNSVEKLNKISAKHQQIAKMFANASNVGTNLGDARGQKQFYASLGRDLSTLSKSIDRMTMMQNMAQRQGRFSQVNSWARQQRQPYGYDPMHRSTTQMSGIFRNMMNPRIDNAQNWFGRRGSALSNARTNLNNMTFNRDPEYRNRNAPPGLKGGIPIPSMFHSARNLGGNVKDFFGIGKGKDDVDENGEPKKGLGGKLKSALKSPLGIIGGVGGAAMLGKKLIDSSPMLQAMMKMLSTTFTLILRPIGDFVGGMLRPITMFMLKEIAIPMAKQGKGFMKFGEEIGNKVLGFFLRPIESIKAAIINAVYPMIQGTVFDSKSAQQDAKWAENYNGVTDWKLQKMIDNSEEGSEKQNTAKWLKEQQKLGNLSDAVITKSMDLLGGNVGSMGLDGSKAFGISEGALETAEDASDSVDEFLVFIQQMEASGAITASEADEMAHWLTKAKEAGVTTARNAIDMATVFAGANTAIQNKLESLYKLQMSLAAAAGPGSGARKRYTEEANKTRAIQTSLRNADGTFNTQAYQDKYFNNSALVPSASNNVDAKAAEEARAKQARDTQDRMAAAATQRAKNEAIKNKLAAGKNTLGFDGQAEKIWDLVKDGTLSDTEGTRMINKLYQDMIQGADKITISGEGARILQNAETSNAGSDGAARKQAEDYNANLAEWVAGGMVGPAPQMGDLRGEGYENAAWSKPLTGSEGKTWRDYIGMANGGVINEPILGVGRSGQKYAFGESGREFVTPERKSGGTVFNVININVGNVNRDADFDKLKPLIQRWILESNSRRGMI